MTQRPFFGSLSDSAREHLATAIDFYLRQSRRIGQEVPDELPALMRHLRSPVIFGHAQSPPAGPPETVDGGPMAPKLVTTDGAAHLLSCSESTVRRLIRNGALSAVRLGPGATRLRVTDIDQYVAHLGDSRQETRCP